VVPWEVPPSSISYVTLGGLLWGRARKGQPWRIRFLARDIPLFTATTDQTDDRIVITKSVHIASRKMSDQSREKATIFVGGLDSQVTAETLHDAFIPFGEIADISLPKPELCVGRSITCSYVNSMLNLFSRKSSQESHRGFGYVEFSLPEDAHEAIDNMDQSELYGRVIKVNQAKPQKQAGEKLGSKTAIWEQVNKDFLCFRLEADC
jgi:hypothetical protein